MAVTTKRIIDVYVDRTEDTSDTKVLVKDRIILGLLMVFVFGMSIFFFSNQSLRLDEAQSLWQSSHNVLGILKVIAEDVHVPFYHMILHVWQIIFGNDVAMARFLSLSFFILTIPAIYMLGRLVYGRSVALFAALLMAISPFLNWYGNEIRMYSLFTLLIILHLYFFLRIFKGDSEMRNWLAFGAIAVVGIFTHYFFFLALLTEFVFYLFFREEFPRGTGKRLCYAAVIIGIFYLPWIYYVYSVGLIGNSTPYLTEPTTVNLFNAFSQFLFGFQNDHLNTILVSLWPLTILFGSLALREHRRISSQTIFFLLMLIIPVAVAFIVSSFLRPIFVTRYLILTVPALYLFLGWIFSTYTRNLQIIFKTLLVAAMLFTLGIQATSAAVPVKENYREVADYLTQHAKPQDVIILSAPFTLYPIEYYYRGSAELKTLPIWNRYSIGPIPPFSEEKLPEEVETLKGLHQTAWVVLSYDQGYEEKIRAHFDNNYERLEAKNFSKGLNLYAYKLRYYNPTLDELLKNESEQN